VNGGETLREPEAQREPLQNRECLINIAKTSFTTRLFQLQRERADLWGFKFLCMLVMRVGDDWNGGWGDNGRDNCKQAETRGCDKCGGIGTMTINLES